MSGNILIRQNNFDTQNAIEMINDSIIYFLDHIQPYMSNPNIGGKIMS
jgi:hypothetical protein